MRHSTRSNVSKRVGQKIENNCTLYGRVGDISIVANGRAGDEATSPLASLPRPRLFRPDVFLSRCLHFVHALSPPRTTMRRVWPARYPASPGNIYLYLRPFLSPALQKDSRVLPVYNAVTRPWLGDSPGLSTTRERLESCQHCSSDCVPNFLDCIVPFRI